MHRCTGHTWSVCLFLLSWLTVQSAAFGPAVTAPLLEVQHPPAEVSGTFSLSDFHPNASGSTPLSLFSPQALPPLALEHVFLVPSQPCSSTWTLLGKLHQNHRFIGKVWKSHKPGLSPAEPSVLTSRSPKPKDFLLSSSVSLLTGPITRPQLLSPVPACSLLRLPSSTPTLPLVVLCQLRPSASTWKTSSLCSLG